MLPQVKTNQTRIIGATVAAVFALVLATMNAGAADISLNTGGASLNNNEGDVLDVASADVPAENVGELCGGTVVATNNNSVHPGNTLIISSGGQTLEIPDVEDGAGQVTIEQGAVVLGDTVTVQLRLGPKGITSGGIEINLTCIDQELPVVTTSTTAPETTTTLPPTAKPEAKPVEPDYTG